MMLILLSLAGTVIALVIGMLWYSPLTPMGRLHMRSIGFDKLSPEEQKKKIEEAKPTMWKSFMLQGILSLMSSLAVVMIVTMSAQNGLSLLTALGFVVFNWLAFTVPTVGSSIIWGNIEREIAWKKFFSDIFCPLVTLLLTGLVAGLVG